MISFYVHHRASLTRTAALLRALRTPATVFTSADATGLDLSGAALIPLPSGSGAPLDACTPASPDASRGAPARVPGLRRQVASLGDCPARSGAGLLVVDGAYEVAALGRLLSLPVVMMRRHGARTDEAHRLAYTSAVALLAPYPEALEDPTAPPWVRAKTFYVGGYSRFDGQVGQSPVRSGPGWSGRGRRVVVLADGATGLSGQAIGRAARACPDWTWTVVGHAAGMAGDRPENVERVGATADPFPLLLSARVVVAPASHSHAMAVGAARRPLVALADAHPSREQLHRAEVLEQAALAVCCPRWPRAEAWPGLLQRACALDPSRWAAVVDGAGATRAAQTLDQLHEQFRPTPPVVAPVPGPPALGPLIPA